MDGRPLHRITHLVRRFFGSLRPGGPNAVDRGWVRSVLSASEYELWASMSGPDRRHSVVVARDVRRRLGDDATTPVLAAALLHDSGKVASGLHTPMRVVATILAAVGDRSRAIERWSGRAGARGRIARYLDHAEIGAVELERRGSDPLVVEWARSHHRPDPVDGIDPRIGGALRDADDD